MLEIIAIIQLSKKISKMVKGVGLTPWKYVTIMIILWIGFEMTGAILGTIYLGEGLAAYPFAILGAILGGYIGYLNAQRATNNASNSMPEDILDSQDMT